MDTIITSSPWGFRFFTHEEYCAAMKGLGIQQLCVLCFPSDTLPLSLGTIEKGTAFRLLAQGYGLQILEAAITLDRPQDIAVAAATGAKYLRICEVWEKTSAKFKQITDQIRQLGELAKGYGMTVIVENHGGLMANADDCRAFFKAVKCENVLLNFDGANFLAFAGQNPGDALHELKDLIAFAHVKNVSNSNQFCRIADGVIDYQPMIKTLAKMNIPIALEYECSDDVLVGTSDDLSSLRKLLGSA